MKRFLCETISSFPFSVAQLCCWNMNVLIWTLRVFVWCISSPSLILSPSVSLLLSGPRHPLWGYLARGPLSAPLQTRWRTHTPTHTHPRSNSQNQTLTPVLLCKPRRHASVVHTAQAGLWASRTIAVPSLCQTRATAAALWELIRDRLDGARRLVLACWNTQRDRGGIRGVIERGGWREKKRDRGRAGVPWCEWRA